MGVAAAVPAVGALLLFYGVMFILKTGCIDPGIVPRAHPDEVAYQAALADEGKRKVCACVCVCVRVYVCVCVCMYMCV